MPYSPESRIPTVADVKDAAKLLHGRAVATPLVESPLLNDQLGGRLLAKAEMLQHAGAFKFRGAFNRLSRLDEEERKRGVVAYSSGNHAQGVAVVARMLGIPALIVMPKTAPGIKIANTRAYGAEVVLYDPQLESREELGGKLSAERGATLVPPYDDPDIISGQGTVGLELAAQAREKDARLDAVLIPCGGGGLTAGCALALAEECPGTPVYCVEPEGFDDTARSLEAGKRITNPPGAVSFCDALPHPTPGALTFGINKRLLAGGLAVGDDKTAAAMAAAFTYFKLVVEPGGAVALAAALSGAFDCSGKTVAVVCSGGNVDPDLFRSVLERQT